MHYTIRWATSVVALCMLGTRSFAGEPEHVVPVFSGALPVGRNVRLTAAVVSYPPGGTSAPHRHAGSVFAYVLDGVIRSKNSATGAARLYHAGESFFEPAGSFHEISANASTLRPARLLAVFVARADARLTTPSIRK